MKYNVIIPAAGQGKRMGAGKNKQFIELQNKPVIIHTLEVFEQDVNCQDIILVVSEHDYKAFEELVADYHIKKVRRIALGGKERQDSVYNGLKMIKSKSIVLVHDGARPFITQPLISQLVQEAVATGAAVAAVPVKDTIKVVDNGTAVNTLDRSSLWAVQTPQAFRLSLILDAYRTAEEQSYNGTDDASLVENIGKSVSIVKGDYYNIKLTTKDDLLYANAILNERSLGGVKEDV